MRAKLDARHYFLRSFGTPIGWRSTTLGDLASVIGGGTPSRAEARYWQDATIPWATPTDLTASDSKFISRTFESISDAGLGSSGATLLPVGTVLFTSRASIGAMAITTCSLATNQGFANFVPKNIHVGFLYYLLRALTPVIKRLGAGTTFDEISKRDIRKVHCAIPELVTEQVEIARTGEVIDAAIESARVALASSKAFDHSLLHEILADGIGIGRGAKRLDHWKQRRVDEVADVGSGVTLGKDITGFKHIELPYLRVANVQDGHLNLETIKSVKVRRNEVDRYRLEPGDVLMTEGGDLDKLGRGAMWEGQIPDCLHQNHIFRVRADRSQLEPAYFACIVESDIAKRYFTRVAKRTTNLASTNKTQVRAFRFPLPPLEEQRQIVEVVKASKAKIRALEQKEAALRQLKQSLMHDLLTGTVRIPPALFTA